MQCPSVVVVNGRVYFGSGMFYVIGHLDDKLHALSLGG
jgi:hypothetical protein